MNEEVVVYVVDDDPAIRKSLRWLISSVGLQVQTFASAQEFLDEYQIDSPGCLVTDVRMPSMSGLDLQEALRERNCEIPVILVTGYGDVPMAVRAMKGGAVDFIEKPVSDQVLLDHIQKAIAIDLGNQRNRAENLAVNQRAELLTQREREVMNLVVTGMSSKEIAAELNVSLKTIEAHRAKIMKKMEAKSVPQLIHMCLALRSGKASEL